MNAQMHTDVIDEGLRARLCRRRSLHQYAMERLPADGLGPSPRQAAGFQFRIDLPGDPLYRTAGARGDGKVRLQMLWRAGALDLGAETVAVGEQMTVQVRLWTGTRNDHGGGEWGNAAWDRAAALLARHGFELAEDGQGAPMVVGPAVRGVCGPQREVTARVRVTDAVAAQAAFDNGIGRAKNYGLGMLVRL